MPKRTDTLRCKPRCGGIASFTIATLNVFLTASFLLCPLLLLPMLLAFTACLCQWDYMMFAIHVMDKDPNEYTGVESSVAEMMDHQDYHFMNLDCEALFQQNINH